LRVVIAHPEHKIRARRADLRAVLKQTDMFRGSVFAAHLQAVMNSLQTNRVAVHTVADAVLHLLTHRVMCSRVHKNILLEFRRQNRRTVKVKTKKRRANSRKNLPRRRSRLIRVLSRIGFKFALTRGRTKVVCSALVIGLSGGCLFLDLHSANRVNLLCHKLFSSLSVKI
jgi:hypothetical protein